MNIQQNLKVNLLGLNYEALQEFFLTLGEKSFRAQQVMKWIYHQGISYFSQMTNLSLSLRESLAEIACIEVPKIISEQRAGDGTIKWLLAVDDSNAIETVYIPGKERNTLCISSQVGCSLDCTFCATARQGFNRNLTAAEILGQYWIAENRLKESFKLPKVITNVVFMGMGEPLLNFDHVVTASKIMMNDFGYGLSKRRVTISTSGVVPKIDKLKNAVDVSLAVSLHAPNDELRNQLVPLNRRYPVADLLAACERYISDKNRKTAITFEYVLIDDVNDKVEHALELSKLLRSMRCKVNLIPFNPFPGIDFQRSQESAIERFSQVLQEAGITTIVRRPRGEDIAAACGQLAGKIQDLSRRELHFTKLYDQSLANQSVKAACL